MVTITVHNWITSCTQGFSGTVIDWLHSIKHNRHAYELAYACIHYFIPYWCTRAALKWNTMEDLQVWWRYWTHLFIATGKYNYSIMSIRYLWMLWALHPQVKALYDQHHVLSFSGEAGTGIPYDGVAEIVCTSSSAHVLTT